MSDKSWVDSLVDSILVSMTSPVTANATDLLWARMLMEFPVLPDTKGCGTFRTNGVNIYYSRELIDKINKDLSYKKQNTLGFTGTVTDKVKFLFAHEVMHIVYNHIKNGKLRLEAIPGPYDRAFKVLHEIYNDATDSIINMNLLKEFGEEKVLKKVDVYDEKTGEKVLEFVLPFYQGDENATSAEVFVQTCNSASMAMAEILKKEIQEYPKDFYGSIALFRSLFNQLSEKIQELIEQIMCQDDKSGQDNQDGQGNQQGQIEITIEQEAKRTVSESEQEGGQEGKTEQDAQKIIDAMKKVLGGIHSMDSHEELEIAMENMDSDTAELVKNKLERALKDVAEMAKNKGIGTQGKSILAKIAWEEFFTLKPEPWYMGLLHLFRQNIRYGRVVREKIPAPEMLSQIMGNKSIIHFDRKGKKVNLVYAVDVSGSMENDDVVEGILRIAKFMERELPKGTQGHKLIFVQMDADITSWEEMTVPSLEYSKWLKSIKNREFTRTGCGGTAFAPLFEKINKMPVKPDGIVIFTDMGVYDFDRIEPLVKNYHTNVIWLTTMKSIPKEFKERKLGKVYELNSLFDEIRRNKEVSLGR